MAIVLQVDCTQSSSIKTYKISHHFFPFFLNVWFILYSLKSQSRLLSYNVGLMLRLCSRSFSFDSYIYTHTQTDKYNNKERTRKRTSIEPIRLGFQRADTRFPFLSTLSVFGHLMEYVVQHICAQRTVVY